MKRRNSFRAIVGTIGCFIAHVAGRCVALAETTKYYWPGHWSESALRKHLISSPKHHFPPSAVKGKSFQELIDMHDAHHVKIGDKSRMPFPGGKHVPGTPKGRG